MLIHDRDGDDDFPEVRMDGVNRYGEIGAAHRTLYCVTLNVNHLLTATQANYGSCKRL